MIELTDLAAEKIKQKIKERGSGLGIKVGVKPSGCNGFSYVLEYIDQPDSDFEKFEINGVNIWINPRDHLYIAGMTMDWKTQGLNQGFEFENPNSKGSCGCGESFNV
jgi:iron-sulfur cluster assembly protein